MENQGSNGSKGSNLLAHLMDVTRLSPEVAQLDVLNFEATIPAAGAITQPIAVKIPSGYAYEIFGIAGYFSSPGDAVANFPLATFNIKEGGKRDIFGTAQSMAMLVNILGPMPPIFFPRSLYLVSPGGDLTATFARATGWNGGTKTVGVQLFGGLVAPSTQRDRRG